MTKKKLEKELQKLSKYWIGDIMCSQWMEQVLKLVDEYKRDAKIDTE